MVTCLWTRIERRKWQRGICRAARPHGHAAEISAFAAHLGCGQRSGESVRRYAWTWADGGSNLIQCETAFLDFSLTGGSSE